MPNPDYAIPLSLLRKSRGASVYLRPAEVTVAQLLKDAGKWHLNSKNP